MPRFAVDSRHKLIVLNVAVGGLSIWGACRSLLSPPMRQSDEQRTNTKRGAVCIPFKQTTCSVSLLKDLGGILPEVPGICLSQPIVSAVPVHELPPDTN